MKVVAIIPAYNEVQTISEVLSIVTAVDLIERVIVVNDGSSDLTAEEVIKHERVDLIDLLINRGKGGAVKAGLDHSESEIVLILDADLLGLTVDHVKSLLIPVLNDETLMTVGIFENGRVATDFAQMMAPFLSGQRALKRELLENVSDLDLSRFGIEVALYQYVEENNIGYQEIYLKDLSHVMKEEKLGMTKGVLARLKMYFEIIKYLLRVDSKP